MLHRHIPHVDLLNTLPFCEISLYLVRKLFICGLLFLMHSQLTMPIKYLLCQSMYHRKTKQIGLHEQYFTKVKCLNGQQVRIRVKTRKTLKCNSNRSRRELEGQTTGQQKKKGRKARQRQTRQSDNRAGNERRWAGIYDIYTAILMMETGK